MPSKNSIRKLPRSFYARDAKTVAVDLLGCEIVRIFNRKKFRARIVETEAYVGIHDLACHASKGRTPRTEVMFGPPGFAYVYLIYGIHHMFNVVVNHEGNAEAVLIRACEPIYPNDVRLNGPGLVAKALHITREMNKYDLLGNALYLCRGNPPTTVCQTPRIGVDYAKHWRDAPLRFFDANSACVSKTPKSGGS